jgi:hypothetical protein
MGIKSIIGIGGDRELECQQDPTTRELTCRTFRRKKDGSEENLAFERIQLGSDCKPVITESRETKEGELEILEKRILPKVTTECERLRPSEY